MYGVPGIPLMPPDAGGASMAFPLEQPKNLFRYGEQTIWSTQMHQGAAGGAVLANGTFRVFTTPIGQVGQGFANALSIAETNLKEGGRIPSGVAYDVFGVACHIMISTATLDTGTLSPLLNDNIVPAGAVTTGTAVVVNITNNLILSWDFTQTQVDIAPASLVGAGGGVFGSVSVGDDVAVLVGAENNGNGSLWLYRKHPVALPGNSTFAILMRYGSRTAALGAADASIAVKLTLLGYYKNIIEIGN